MSPTPKTTTTKPAAAWIRRFELARRAAAPLVAISTPDQAACIEQLLPLACRDFLAKKDTGAILSWDRARGLVGINATAKQWLTAAFPTPPAPAGMPAHLAPKSAIAQTVDFVVAMDAVMRPGPQAMPPASTVFVHNAQFLFDDHQRGPVCIQAIANARDVLKMASQTLVLMAPIFRAPIEIKSDVVSIDEPMPDAELVREIINQQYANIQLKPPTDANESYARAVDALCGVPAFAVETVAAMSITREGLNIDEVMSLAKATIAQTRGLEVYVPKRGEGFERIGGNEGIKRFLRDIERHRIIVWLDEVEKLTAGSRGDLSGVYQDAEAVLLTHMQESRANGIMLVGLPGGGKSAIVRAAGSELDTMVVRFDLGAMQGGIVGQSQQYIRAAVKVIESLARGRALWLATSNDISALKPEFCERFALGTYFFDMPSRDEKDAIWRIKVAEYGLDANQPMPTETQDAGFVGRNIDAACRIAALTKQPLSQAIRRVVPLGSRDGDVVTRLRQQANGHWLSAATGEVYRMDEPAAAIETPKPDARSRRLAVN